MDTRLRAAQLARLPVSKKEAKTEKAPVKSDGGEKSPEPKAPPKKVNLKG